MKKSDITLCPPPFLETLSHQKRLFEKMQADIKKQNLSKEEERRLHKAIQGYFRDWLVSSENSKKIQDLVRLVD